MTASAHLQITDLVMQQLRADPPLTDGPIERGRALVLAKAVNSAIGVRLVRAPGSRVSFTDGRQWQTVVVIEICKRAEAGEDGHAAVDPLLQDVYQRVSEGALPASVGSLVGDPEIVWDVEEQDPTVGLASLVLRIDHLTARNVLTPLT